MKRLILLFLLSIQLFTGGLSAQTILRTPGGGVAMTSGNKVAMAPAAAPVLKIGDTHQGGIIFYLDGTGGGLIAAPSDQGTNVVWGCAGSTTNATDSSVGGGEKNTPAIVAKCTNPGIAASICVELDIDGFKDWHLPSSGELLLMLNNLHKKGWGNFSLDRPYWSSTEANAGNGLIVDFNNGNQAEVDKNLGFYVRAIRKF